MNSKEIVLKMYAAAAAGDSAGAMACMDDNVTVIEPPYLPYGGTYRGKQEFAKLFGFIGEHGDLSTVKMHYAVGEGDVVFAVLEFIDKKTGKPLQLVEQSTVKNGKIVEMKIFYFDAGSLIEAGLKTKG